MNTYAGIGSRETPADVCTALHRIAAALAPQYTLRSGHAAGADAAFESGAASVGGLMEIWLPWAAYNGGVKLPPGGSSAWPLPTAEGMALAAKYHPNWSACSLGARRLHARNSHIILGKDLHTPAKFVLCWTPGGSGGGGTGQGLRIARAYKIPVLDFGSVDVGQINVALIGLLRGVEA